MSSAPTNTIGAPITAQRMSPGHERAADHPDALEEPHSADQDQQHSDDHAHHDATSTGRLYG